MAFDKFTLSGCGNGGLVGCPDGQVSGEMWRLRTDFLPRDAVRANCGTWKKWPLLPAQGELAMRLLARYSFWKLAGAAAFCLVLGIVPNLSYMGEHATYHAFYYRSALGMVMLVSASAISLCFGVLFVGLLIEALLHPEAMWIEGDRLCWRKFGARSIGISEISAICLCPQNSIRIELISVSKPKEISMGFYRKSDAPEPLLSDLQALIAQR